MALIIERVERLAGGSPFHWKNSPAAPSSRLEA